MNNSWFNKGFDGVEVNDGFFDDVIKYLDIALEDAEGTDGDGGGDGGGGSGEGVIKDFQLPLDDVEENNGTGIDGEDWDCNFQSLEPPPAIVLASLSSCFGGDFFGDALVNNLTVSCDESLQVNQWASTNKASSSRSSTPNGDSVDVKGSIWLQTSSPVSVLETTRSTAAKPTPINPKLSFLVKRDRSKRRRASTFNMHFSLPFIPSASSTSAGSTLIGSESESESHLTEKSGKKRRKRT